MCYYTIKSQLTNINSSHYYFSPHFSISFISPIFHHHSACHSIHLQWPCYCAREIGSWTRTTLHPLTQTRVKTPPRKQTAWCTSGGAKKKRRERQRKTNQEEQQLIGIYMLQINNKYKNTALFLCEDVIFFFAPLMTLDIRKSYPLLPAPHYHSFISKVTFGNPWQRLG